MPRIIPERINLPSGGWASFHDPDDFTGEDQRTIMASVDEDGNRIAMSMDVLYGVLNLLINEWDIPYTPKGTEFPPHEVPTPTQCPGIVTKLKMTDYSMLMGTVTPVTKLLNGGGPANVDDAAVPGSPTVPSGG